MVELSTIYGMILSHNCGHLLEKAYSKIPLEYFDKVFITDDGSEDNSIEIANGLGVKVITSEKSGYGANVKNGLKWAFNNGADYVVEIHGDGAQFNPEAVIPAINFIEKDYDFIIGSRFINKIRTLELEIPKPRYYANILLSSIDRFILRLPFSEFHTGFRIYNKKFSLVNFDKLSDDYLFSFQIIAYAAYKKFKCAEVPVECDYIDDHTSHSYVGATIYAISHFLTLVQFLFAKIKIKIGMFVGQ